MNGNIRPLDLDAEVTKRLGDPEFVREYIAAHKEEIASLTRELEEAKALLDRVRLAGADLLTVVNAGCARGDYWHERRAMNDALNAAVPRLSRGQCGEDDTQP